MTDTLTILIIILSVFLALFLLLAIILIVMLIKVSTKINRITTSVQLATDNIEGVVSGLSKVTSPLLLVKMISKQIKRARKGK